MRPGTGSPGSSEAPAGDVRRPAAGRTRHPDVAGRARWPLDLRLPGWLRSKIYVRPEAEICEIIPADSRVIDRYHPCFFLPTACPFGDSRRAGVHSRGVIR